VPRPTINTLNGRIRSSLSSETNTDLAFMPRSLALATLKAMVGVAHGIFGRIDYVKKQIVPGFATDPDVVADQAASLLKTPWKEKAAGVGPCDFTGTDGVLIPANTTVQIASGVQYKTNATAQIAVGIATVDVTAMLTDDTTGQDTNALEGVTLTLVQPIPGINSSATVGAGGIVGGSDRETIDQVNARIRARLSSSANGSNAAQYVEWALEIPGVTRAWCFPQWLGVSGAVGLAFVRDDDASIVPEAAEVQAMQDYIQARVPADTAGFTAFAPVLEPQDMTIQLSPNTVEVQQAVLTSLQALFDAAAVEDGNGSGVIKLSKIREAISTAEGEDDHIIVSPTTNVTASIGRLATLNTPTWQGVPA